MTYRGSLPQLSGDLFLTDGGIETVLIFQEGLELPEFAAFDLLKDDDGTARLRSYYEPYLELARERALGFVLESPTWRANPRWASAIGYDLEQLDACNRKAIALMEAIRDAEGPDAPPIVISGCVGPHDDGYSPAQLLTAEAAARDLVHAGDRRPAAQRAAASQGDRARFRSSAPTSGRIELTKTLVIQMIVLSLIAATLRGGPRHLTVWIRDDDRREIDILEIDDWLRCVCVA